MSNQRGKCLLTLNTVQPLPKCLWNSSVIHGESQNNEIVFFEFQLHISGGIIRYVMFPNFRAKIF